MNEKNYEEQEVEFTGNGAPVYGTLTLPAGGKAELGFTILHSDERGGRNSEYYEEMAAFFASNGIAVLRYDSPGSGKSPGKAFIQTMDERVNEARAAAALVREKTGLDSSKVGLWGLSEGSLVSLLAGSYYKSEFAFIILASPDYEAWTSEKMLSDMEAECSEEGLSPARMAKELLMIKLWIAYYDLEPYKLEELEKGAALFGAEEGPWNEVLSLLKDLDGLSPEEECSRIYEIIKSYRESWSDYKYGDIYLTDIEDNELDSSEIAINKEIWKNICSIHPYSLAQEIESPVFVLWGKNDEYIDVGEVSAQYEELIKSKNLSGWKLKVYAGADHSIAAEGNGPITGFFDDMLAWIKKRLK